MSLATYSDLKQSIQDWLARADLVTKADDFIDLAEAFFNMELRNLKMEKSDTISTLAGTTTANLPTDYLGLIKLSIANDPAPLQLVSKTFIQDKFRIAQTGRPQYFAFAPNAGTERVLFGPTSDSVYTLNIDYFYGITPLSDSNTTNWLFTKLPNLYLSVCLYEAAKYIKDYEAMALFKAEGLELLDAFKIADRRERQQQQSLRSQVMQGVV